MTSSLFGYTILVPGVDCALLDDGMRTVARSRRPSRKNQVGVHELPADATGAAEAVRWKPHMV